MTVHGYIYLELAFKFGFGLAFVLFTVSGYEWRLIWVSYQLV